MDQSSPDRRYFWTLKRFLPDGSIWVVFEEHIFILLKICLWSGDDLCEAFILIVGGRLKRNIVYLRKRDRKTKTSFYSIECVLSGPHKCRLTIHSVIHSFKSYEYKLKFIFYRNIPAFSKCISVWWAWVYHRLQHRKYIFYYWMQICTLALRPGRPIPLENLAHL